MLALKAIQFDGHGLGKYRACFNQSDGFRARSLRLFALIVDGTPFATTLTVLEPSTVKHV